MSSSRNCKSEKPNRRKCHDCGKLTYNYRCSKCLALWREKHDVTSTDVYEDTYEELYALRLKYI